jgi:hypothetical protein
MYYGNKKNLKLGPAEVLLKSKNWTTLLKMCIKLFIILLLLILPYLIGF